MPISRSRLDARKQTARADFEKWAAGPAKQLLSAKVPGDGLRFYAPLSEGQGRSVAITVDAKPRTLALATDAAWSPGEVSAKAFMAQDKTPLEIAEAGDIDSQQAFSYGGWVKLSGAVGGGAVMARMDDGNAFRGWDMWLENDRPGTHLINHWPDNAIKVVSKTAIQPGKWQHVMITYDGSRRAAGAKVYIDGKPQPVEVLSDSLKDTMRTKVPLTIARRHTTARINGVALQDLRIYGRTLSAVEVDQLASTSRLASILEKPAAQRSKAESEELLDFWIRREDKPFRDLHASVGRDRKRANGHPLSRHGGPRHAGACRAAQGLRAFPRRLRQAAGRSQTGDAFVPSAHAGRVAAEPPRFRPMAVAARASAHRPGDGEPLLAGDLRRRAW